MPKYAGEPYRPSNGTEGMVFYRQFCDKCEKDRNENCEIHTRALIFGVEDKLYPKQWIEDAEGPKCTSFTPLLSALERKQLKAAADRKKKEDSGQRRLF